MQSLRPRDGLEDSSLILESKSSESTPYIIRNPRAHDAQASHFMLFMLLRWRLGTGKGTNLGQTAPHSLSTGSVSNRLQPSSRAYESEKWRIINPSQAKNGASRGFKVQRVTP